MIEIEITRPYYGRAVAYSHELDKQHYIEVAFYENGTNIDTSSNTVTVTATIVCNGFLIAENVATEAVSATGVKGVKLDLGSNNNYTILPGRMLIEFKIVRSTEETYPVAPLVVKVTESIVDDAQVTPESYGTVGEILQEVATARGTYSNLNARLNAMTAQMTLINGAAMHKILMNEGSAISLTEFNQTTLNGNTIYIANLAADFLYSGSSAQYAYIVQPNGNETLLTTATGKRYFKNNNSTLFVPLQIDANDIANNGIVSRHFSASAFNMFQSSLNTQLENIVSGNNVGTVKRTTFVQGRYYPNGRTTSDAQYAYGIYENAEKGDYIYFDSNAYRCSFLIFRDGSLVGQTGWITQSPYYIETAGTSLTIYVVVNNSDGSSAAIDVSNVESSTYASKVLNSNLATNSDVQQAIDENSASFSRELKSEAEELGRLRKTSATPWDIRRNFPKVLSKYDLSAVSEVSEVGVFTDGSSFFTGFDVESKKLSGGTRRVVDKTGGGDFTSLHAAVDASSNGDTIVLKDGFYFIPDFMNGAKLGKNLNIIAENDGKAIVLNGYENVFTAYPNDSTGSTYYIPNYGKTVNRVIDISEIGKGRTAELGKTTSISACVAAEGSYYISSNNTLYVHMYGNAAPTNENCVVSVTETYAPVHIMDSSQNMYVYLQGLTIVGGYPANVYAKNSSTYTGLEVYGKNLRMLYAHSDGVSSGDQTLTYTDALCLRGAKSIMQGCECAFAFKDGFNYHQSAGVVPVAVELDCIGHDCGLSFEENGNNGSTIHDGGKIVRVNGVYYHNKGGNVADINSGTVAINLGCIAFDSCGGNNATNGNFMTQSSGVNSVCDSCVGFGSGVDFYCPDDGGMTVRNCVYTRKGSHVTEVS